MMRTKATLLLWKINLMDLALGMVHVSPDSSIYAEYHIVGLVGETEKEHAQMEDQMKSYARKGQWYNAWQEWNSEFVSGEVRTAIIIMPH